MTFALAEPIVRAVLYEGYVLYPYRSTSIKNRKPFTFGCVFPRAWCDAAQNGDASRMRTECLVLGDRASTLTIAVRFLQPVNRTAGGHDAIERTVELRARTLGELAARGLSSFGFDGALTGEVEVAASEVQPGVFRLAIEIRNTTCFRVEADLRAARDGALLSSFASTHTLVGVRGGSFVSAADPPEALRAAAAACESVGAWPVLLGDPAARDTLLSSPIVLEDHPRLAPESPADLFDATEIDEILTLRILTLTEAEKAEVRASGPRAAALLDRTLALGPEALARMHGTRRAPANVALSAGDRVLIRPRKGGDVMDLALAGMEATVASVETDYEGRVHVAVTVDADPGRDFGEMGMPGHRFFFRADELEPLGGPAS